MAVSNEKLQRRAHQAIERASKALAKAEQEHRDAVYVSYPVGCLVLYRTSTYEVVYRVVMHGMSTFGSPRLQVERAFVNGKKKLRWIYAGSVDSVSLYSAK